MTLLLDKSYSPAEGLNLIRVLQRYAVKQCVLMLSSLCVCCAHHRTPPTCCSVFRGRVRRLLNSNVQILLLVNVLLEQEHGRWSADIAAWLSGYFGAIWKTQHEAIIRCFRLKPVHVPVELTCARLFFPLPHSFCSALEIEQYCFSNCFSLFWGIHWCVYFIELYY